MCKEIDWTNADETIERFKERPSGAMKNAGLNEFKVLACEAAEVTYGELHKKLEGREDLKDLLHIYSHLKYVALEFECITVSDIDLAKKEIFKALLNEVPEPVSVQIEAIMKRDEGKDQEGEHHDVA